MQDLSSLPPIEKDEDDASASDDMGKAELIYRMGIAEKQSPLSLDYLVHFRDSTCLYFTYDLTEAYEKDTVFEYWISDHRIIDIGSGEVVKALHSNLIANEKIHAGCTEARKSFTQSRFRDWPHPSETST